MVLLSRSGSRVPSVPNGSGSGGGSGDGDGLDVGQIDISDGEGAGIGECAGQFIASPSASSVTAPVTSVAAETVGASLVPVMVKETV